MKLVIQTIKPGDRGELVGVWQTFLRGKGLYRKGIDNDFGPSTTAATRAFEGANGLTEDAVVDDFLWDIAIADGLAVSDVRPYEYPGLPDFSPLNFAQRQEKWGKIEYRHEPVAGNSENVVITNDWGTHVKLTQVPQFTTAYGKRGSRMGWPKNGIIPFHEDGVEYLLGFFQYVEDAGLLDLLISFGGSWVPRLIRGGNSLSNHAHAVAFDINVPWNWMGNHPAAIGKYGTLLELVPLAAAWGFYWGGHFARVDGMHFELTKPQRPTQEAAFYTEMFSRRV